MSRRATPIVLTVEERSELQRRVRARTSSQQAAQRARIVLRAADGARNIDIAAELGIARHTAQQWRDRFATGRLAGLEDRPHHPPPREYSAERQARILVVACQSPAELGWSGQTHWSVRDLAQYLASIPSWGWAARARARWARSSRRPTSAWSGFDSWMEERDPDFVAKAVEIIELELHPPADGPTFCVDEKTGIGVRRPAAPSQPVAPGRPARREFEYVRNGTADLLAAFAVRDGQVTAIVRPQHRSREFCELLDRLDRQTPFGQTIHLILDPVSLHRSAEVAVWLAYRPWRSFVFHWLPTHASWLSFVEAWFAILSKKCLKRAELPDFDAADRALTDFIATYNAHQAHPFTWRKGVRFYQRLKDKLDTPAQAAA